MGCCNGDCLGSVTLRRGPAGADGAAGGTGLTGPAGGDGSDGTDGVAIVHSSVTKQIKATNSYATGEVMNESLNGTTLDFGTVEDVMTLEMILVGAKVATAPAYDFKVLYGADTIFDSSAATGFNLSGSGTTFRNAGRITIDMVVSATDTIVPIIKLEAGNGDFTGNMLWAGSTITAAYVAPAVAISSALSGAHDFKIQIKNDTGVAADQISILSYKLTKYLKV